MGHRIARRAASRQRHAAAATVLRRRTRELLDPCEVQVGGMMRIRWGLIAAALFVCLARTSLAHALSMIGPPQISSIEWMAADSDLVLRGVVIGVEEVAFRPGS